MPLGCLATRRFTMTPGRRRVTQLSSTTSLISPAWCISTAACCIFLCRWMQTHIQQHPVQQRFRHAGKSRVFYSSRLLHRSIRQKTKQTARNRTTSRGQIDFVNRILFGCYFRRRVGGVGCCCPFIGASSSSSSSHSSQRRGRWRHPK